MSSTRASTLFVLGVLGLGLGVLLGERLPPTPVAAPVTLVLVTLALLALAKAVRDRVRPLAADGPPRTRPPVRPMTAEQMVRAVVLAKASSPTGALLAGGYLGVFLALLPSAADALRRDAYVALAGAVTSLLVVAAALVLERACRTPEGPDPRG